MGNSLAKDFNGVQLGRGSLPTKVWNDFLAPGSSLLTKDMTVVIRRDDHRKSTIVFNISDMTPLYISKIKKKKRQSMLSVTKDRQGTPLYVKSQSKRDGVFFYRVPQGEPAVSLESSLEETISETSGSSGLDEPSGHSTLTSFDISPTRRFSCSDLPVSAQIDIDSSGSTTVAFLSVVVWDGSGPNNNVPVYKAISIPQVKYGAIVVDMQGHVVAKSFLDEKRMEPIIKISAGADVAGVVEIVTTVIGGEV